jgi:carboxypeptidase family protein
MRVDRRQDTLKEDCMSRWLLGLVMCALVLGGAGTAYAQNAQIIGTIKDNTGGVIPGVTVTAKNQETGLVRVAVSDERGDYRVQALPPGTYTVTVELTGFGTETRSDITLVIDQSATMSFNLKPAALSESITVTGESPMVNTSAATPITSVSNAQIESLPVNSRRWVDLAMLTPGTSQDGIRSQYYRGNVNVGAGGQYYQNGFIVDGVNNTWAEMGEPRQNFAMDSIREFNVSTSNMKAEYGLATGGMVTVVSKSGTNTLHGSSLLFLRAAGMTAKEYFQTEAPDYKRYQYGGTIGGPIVRDKTHYFFAYERTDENVFLTANARGLWPEYEGTFLSDQYRWTYTAKIDHQISRDQSLFLRIAQEYEYRPINTVNGRTTPSASLDFSVPRDSYVVGHTWLMSPRVINDSRFQYAFSKYEVAPPYSHGSWDAGDFSEDRLKWCKPVFSYPSISIGGCGSTQMGPESRWEAKDDISFVFGNHQLKTGVDFSYVAFAGDSAGSPLGSWTFPKDAPYDPNDRTTWPTSYTNSLPTYGNIPVKIFATYVQDDWKLGRFTFNLGLRYDVQYGSYNENLYDQMKVVAEKLNDPYYAQYPMPIPWIDVTKRGDRNNFGPRTGVVWDATGNGRTIVHAAFGLFYDNIRTLQNFGEFTWMQSRSIQITNPTFPDPLNGRSRESYISTAPPNITVYDNAYKSPYARHYNIGVSRMLSRNFALTVDATSVDRYGERETVDINLPSVPFRANTKPYPQFNRISYGQSSSDSTYRALLVKAEKRMSDHYQLMASYTLAKSKDIGFTNSQADFYGYQKVETWGASDRRHRLVLSGILQLPYQMQASVIGDFRSPLRFSPSSNLGDLNGDGYTGDLPAGIVPGSGCRDLNLDALNTVRAARGLSIMEDSDINCATYVDLDIRFSKFFNIRRHRLEGIVQLFNITNRANFNTPNSQITSAVFGTPNALVPYLNAPSRQAEVAIRWQF